MLYACNLKVYSKGEDPKGPNLMWFPCQKKPLKRVDIYNDHVINELMDRIAKLETG